MWNKFKVHGPLEYSYFEKISNKKRIKFQFDFLLINHLYESSNKENQGSLINKNNNNLF